jgi:TonB family protein
MGYSQTISNPRRAITFVIVLMLHALLIWAPLISLNHRAVQETPDVINVVLIPAIPAQKDTLRVPNVKWVAPRLPTITVPHLVIEVPPAPSDAPMASASQLAGLPVGRRAANIIWPQLDPRHPPAHPPYHDQAGGVLLNMNVNERGKVTDAIVAETSGYKALDDAAIKEALRTWQLLPGTVDGKPAAMRFSLWAMFWKYTAGDGTRHRRTCVQLNQVDEMPAIDDKTILIRMKANTYKLVTANNCKGLRSHGFAHNTFVSDLCETDVVLSLQRAAVPCVIDKIVDIDNTEGKTLLARRSVLSQSQASTAVLPPEEHGVGPRQPLTQPQAPTSPLPDVDLP